MSNALSDTKMPDEVAKVSQELKRIIKKDVWTAVHKMAMGPNDIPVKD